MQGLAGVYEFGNNGNQKMTINFEAYNNKFNNDNIFQEDDDFIIALEGCILNIDLIKKQFNVNGTSEIIRVLWKKYNEKITEYLRGSFVLAIFDKKTEKLFLTNDLLSKRPLYIFVSKNYLMFSSRYTELVNTLKLKNEKLSINKLAVAMMLVNGILSDDITFSKEISYVTAYKYMIVDNDGMKILNYNINNDLLTIDEEEIIRELDKKFSFAVEEQFNKNKENGYRQLSTLSAGMDSRSCILYANKLKYEEVLCINYSQSDSVDYSISKQIAFDYNYEYMFYPLDSASFILNADILCERNECQQAYAGSTGAFSSFKLLDTAEYGIIHTGLLGGELLSDIFVEPRFTDINYKNSKMLELPLCDNDLYNQYSEILRKYRSQEEFLLFYHTRACQNFIRMVDHKCEVFSPFMHEDFFSFANRIPPEFRYRRNIYRRWMEKCIPNRYITTYFKTEVNTSYGKEFLIKVLNRFIKSAKGINKFEMNPFEYWNNTVPNLSKRIDKIYETELERCNHLSNDIKQSIIITKNEGIQGTIRAITALKALKMLF